ncbi:MAG: SAM-dependent chlorinase/fluorinase [Candidatus Nanohaloarchaeota archaeon QJJ-5]|nr:SAM-dependent chlorinase/fluorinase [Candidatus Nanohaloarchaeota archaeon QJJ-5]
MTFLQIIADYGTDDPAFGEVIQRLKTYDPSCDIHYTSVPAFSTINTGFWIQQFACCNPKPDEMAIYANTAPRNDDTDPRPDDGGSSLYYTKAEGTPIIAVNAGHTFSFVKDDIENFYPVDVANEGSQFRSRDYYPEAVIDLLKDKKERLHDSVDPSIIPDPPSAAIAHIDGYGNIKTTIRASSVKQHGSVSITIDGITHEATQATAGFGVTEGTLAFAPGSSGGEDPYMEIFLRGGSAAAQFDHPTVGQSVERTTST